MTERLIDKVMRAEVEGRRMKISLPLTVTLPRKTKDDRVFILNLNNYRNTHHMTLNPAKLAYKGIVGEVLEALPADQKDLGKGPFQFTYTIYPGSARAFDLGNVCSIVQKFTDDALTEYGIINDDNYKIVRRVCYEFGGIDKVNPRAELEIVTI